MKPPKQKIVIIYHGDCPDGFGGAWAAWKKFGNRAAYLPARDRFAPPCPLKGKEIYLIDYTYKPDLVRKLIRENKRVTAIDHHVTAEEAVKLTQKYSFDLHHSGAVLAWNYFHPGKKVPALLRYVEDEDLWNWVLPHAKEILTVLGMEDLDFAVWNRAAKDLENPEIRKTYIQKGKLLLQYEEKFIDELLQYAEPVRFAGRRVFVVNAPHRFNSELGHVLAKMTNSFSAVWWESGGRINVSLRSVAAVDVSKIAKKFGGGGHKRSSGFSFPAGKTFPWKRIATKK